jgi:FeS assembly SUF system regulator
MLRIAKMTDYGLLVMAHLAKAAPDARSASQIAAAAHLPRPTVSKLLKMLGTGGLLIAQRGAHGGYRLGRPATDISLAQILVALEGGVALTACAEGDDGCEREATCELRGNWRRIDYEVRRTFSGITLADMTREATTPSGWPEARVESVHGPAGNR